MPNSDDSLCFPAFKEWQVVCDALASGEQALILRKGGIAEGRQGFRWQHDGFFLFPTRFHQQVDGVKGGRGLAEESVEGGVEISLWAEVLLKGRIADWSQVEALAPNHIWTPDVIGERFEWGDEPGLSVALVRVRKLDGPWILGDAGRREFGGCRSWLELPREEWSTEDGSPEENIAKAKPVIEEAALSDQLQMLRELLGDLG